jgi:hypothetical protein
LFTRDHHQSLSHMNPFNTLPSYFLKIHFNIILPSTPVSSEWSLYLRLSNRNFLPIYFLPIRAICPAHFSLLDLAIVVSYLVKTNYEVLRGAVFSTLLSLHSCQVEMFSSALCSETSSICILLFMWKAPIQHNG